VLFITEQFPYPLDTGGNVRTFHLLKGLAEEHEVVLLATTRDGLSEERLDAVRPWCSQIQIVRVPEGRPLRDAMLLARSLIDRSALALTRHFRSEVSDRIGALMADGRRGAGAAAASRPAFDAVHFNHLDAALYADRVPNGVRKVLDEHNVVTNQVRTMLASEPPGVRRWVLEREVRKLPRFEAGLCNAMDLCLACSEDDAQSLRALGVHRPLSVVPNGVDLEYFHPAGGEPEPCTMVFVGTLDYEPCEKGVWYFCREILPLIRRQMPQARFVAIGRHPSKRLRNLAASDPAIRLPGRVEDVRQHVWSAAVSVVPLLSGSGTRLKILEAMAMGSPVVSTSIGIEGIGARDRVHALIADDPQDFAAAALRVMSDRALAGRLAVSGRALVESRFGWPSVRRALLEGYRALDARAAA
jgi:glycosyltransferase involved in cell wall biosynthesis